MTPCTNGELRIDYVQCRSTTEAGHVVERNGGTELALVTNFRALPDLLEPLEPLLRRALSAPDRAAIRLADRYSS